MDKNFEKLILKFCEKYDCMINESKTTVYIQYRKKEIAFTGLNRWQNAVEYMNERI